MHDIVRVHEVAGLEHLPDDLLCLKGFDSGKVVPALQLIEYRPVQLLEY